MSVEPTKCGNGSIADNEKQIADGEKHSSLRDAISPPMNQAALSSDVLFLCAEPGMGKSYLASQLLTKARGDGRPLYQFAYENLLAELACARIVRCCRELGTRADEGKRPLVVFDNIPAGDEAQSQREARAIRNLVAQGAQVIVTLRPEAEQLVEQIEESTCLRSRDFLFREGNDERIMELTGGIPSLVTAIEADRAMEDDRGYGGRRYIESLCSLVSKTLRAGLPDEETRIRFAMLLLGKGTMDEVALVAGRCDTEQLQWLARDVPLLGIDAGKRTFCCHGLCADEVFDRCAQALCEHAALETQIVVRACGALAAREDIRRSASVSRLCSSESDHASVCAAWGVAYVSIGEAQLVSEALKRLRVTGVSLDARAVMSEVAAVSVTGTARQVDAAWESLNGLRLSGSMEERLYHRVQLLGACRDILRNPRQASTYLTSEAHDTTGLACLDHLKTVRILSSGRFEEAYATMSNEMLLQDPQSLPEALLCDDLMLALVLSGGVPDAKERDLFAKAEAFFAHPGSKRLRAYHAAVTSIPGILMASEHDVRLLEGAAARAERAGDSFFQAVCLLVAAVADVRAHAFSRAHVRAARAIELFRVMGEEYLASAAELIDAIAREMLGEGGQFSRYCEASVRSEGLALVGRILARATGELEGAGAGFVIPTASPCPRGVLWLINLLVSDCADIWANLRDVIPLTWVELLQTIRHRQAHGVSFEWGTKTKDASVQLPQGEPRRLGRGGQTEIALLEEAQSRVRVSIFGGFRVELEGSVMPAGFFERRRARDLIMLLAMVPGHKVRRYQAIEVLWPEEDYFRGPRKLYETTGEARKRMGGLKLGINAVVSDRLQGTIGFDASVVRCDIDDFEREARIVLSEDGDDFEILEHARRMERIYAGGPDEHASDLGELVNDRLTELCALFVDASVAAGEAALRLGKARLAVRYGTDALRLADLREDAMILLVRALKAAGRSCEIPDAYKRYSRRLVETQGIPPSVALRLIVERAMGMGSETDADDDTGSVHA